MLDIEISHRHLWIGVFWERWDESRKGWKEGDKKRLDVWIAIPFLAFHFYPKD